MCAKLASELGDIVVIRCQEAGVSKGAQIFRRIERKSARVAQGTQRTAVESSAKCLRDVFQHD
jgi:hypothetical protein